MAVLFTPDADFEKRPISGLQFQDREKTDRRYFSIAGPTMPQILLPIFPPGVTEINNELAFEKRDGRIYYFNRLLPVFSHDEQDLRTFRLITAQFYVNGAATQAEICRAFGVPPISVKRAVKIYRAKGPAGFYAPRPTRGAAVLTAPVLAETQQLLDEGLAVQEVAERLGLKKDTLSKALRAGRLRQLKKKRAAPAR